MSNRVIGVLLLVVGGVLLFYGLESGDSLVSNVKEAVDGTPTDRSMGLIIGGAASGALGVGLLLKGRR